MRASEVPTRPVAELVPYARNSRTHSEVQVAQIAASIRKFGFTNPVLIDGEGGIIAGHGRVLAAQSLGLEAVPVLVLDHLTHAQRRACVIADNKLALNAGWDEDVLRAEIEALGEGFDLDLLGFDGDELDALLNPPNVGERDPDDVPDLPTFPTSVAGDVWLMAGHRLVCGDTLDAATVAAATNGEMVDCVFTSPPYGVGIDYGATYTDTIENVRAMLPKLAALWLPHVIAGGYAVTNFADQVAGKGAAGTHELCEYPMALEYWPAFRAAGWMLHSRRIWAKPHAKVAAPWTATSSRGATDWEHVWTWKAPGKPITGRSKTSPLGVWDTSRDEGVDIGKDRHGAGMPVALVTRSLDVHSRPGKLVLEPFCGTGTTIVGAEAVGRRCAAIEINPAYVDMAVLRWEEFTGKTATLEATGQTFAEVEAERMESADASRAR